VTRLYINQIRSISLANIASAKKRARQAIGRRLRNASQRSMLRSQIKKVVVAVQTGNREIAQKAYQDAVPVIDSMVNKGLIHKNKAARHKSRLNTRIQALA
jgi:small subunit ribosomal protein S20